MGHPLLDVYDEALPQVFGYVLHRCRDVGVAEDVTAEAFLAAVDAVRRDAVGTVTVAWLITVARNKLVDHWRRQAREERSLSLASTSGDVADVDDPWDAHLDASVAVDVLQALGSHHRAALTLRYLDGLPVPEVAELLGRTVHATEALLTRAKSAFRRAYEEVAADAG